VTSEFEGLRRANEHLIRGRKKVLALRGSRGGGGEKASKKKKEEKKGVLKALQRMPFSGAR